MFEKILNGFVWENHSDLKESRKWLAFIAFTKGFCFTWCLYVYVIYYLSICLSVSNLNNYWSDCNENCTRDISLDKEVPLNFGNYPESADLCQSPTHFCQQLHVITTDWIFVKMLPEVYVCAKKPPINFESYLESEDLHQGWTIPLLGTSHNYWPDLHDSLQKYMFGQGNPYLIFGSHP